VFRMSKSPIIIGIAGGTGSGKTLLAKYLKEYVGDQNATILDQDSYYRDLSDLTIDERRKTNFDIPDAIDVGLLANHLRQLKSGNPINKPVYNFSSHTRKNTVTLVPTNKVIIFEGILVLCNEEVRELIDLKIYVDADPDIRLIRRLKRDILERNRRLDEIIEQYLSTVRPMHFKYVEETKQYADIILDGNLPYPHCCEEFAENFRKNISIIDNEIIKRPLKSLLGPDSY